jgi:hypothetical protein
MQNKNNSFILVYFNYLFIGCLDFGQWNIVEHKRENIFLKKESSWRGLDSLMCT